MYILMLFKYKFKNKVLNIFVIILFLIEKIKIYVNFVFRFEILLKKLLEFKIKFFRFC